MTITLATRDDPEKPRKENEREKTPKAETEDDAPIAAYVVGGIGVAALGVALLIDLNASATLSAGTSAEHPLRVGVL